MFKNYIVDRGHDAKVYIRMFIHMCIYMCYSLKTGEGFGIWKRMVQTVKPHKRPMNKVIVNVIVLTCI